MIGRLNKQDSVTILKYYNIDYDKKDNVKSLRDSAEKVLSEKLCRCIGKIGGEEPTPKEKQRAIALCKASVLTKKGLTDKGFSCKKRQTLSIAKRSSRSRISSKPKTRKNRK